MADIRQFVMQKTGAFYGLLFEHKEYFFYLVLCVVLFVVFLKVKDYLKMKKAKRIKIESTNKWWDWDEYEKVKKNK